MSHLTAMLGHDAIDDLLWCCCDCCCDCCCCWLRWCWCWWWWWWWWCWWWCCWCWCDDDDEELCARLSVNSFWNIGSMATSSSSPSDSVFTRDMQAPPSDGGEPVALGGEPAPVEPPDSRRRPWYTLGVLCMCGADGRLSPGPRFRDGTPPPPPPPIALQDSLFSDAERCMELAVVTEDELSSSVRKS